MHKSRQTAVFLALAIGFSAAAPLGNAQDALLSEAKGVPASIHKVEAGGHWMRGKEEGFFRVVVAAGGVEHVVHRLYLQWLKVDPGSQDYRLVRTTPVTELNKGHGSVLTIQSDFTDLGRLKLMIKANPRGGGAAQRFVLTATGDGAYALRSQ